jgi:hypothetical protein
MNGRAYTRSAAAWSGFAHALCSNARTHGRSRSRRWLRQPGELDPVDHHHGQLELRQAAREQLVERPARPPHERRETAGFEVERASRSTSAPTGSAPRRDRRVEAPASIRSSAMRSSRSREPNSA